MYDCECLIHPFQNDPGTSQSQRVMDELLSGAAQIDARTLADLLDYFVQLSQHINYYDTNLNISDWQLFFKNSIPFTLASVIKNPTGEIENNFAYYNSLFEKKPSSAGLQLHAYFIFYRFINKINSWHLAVKDSGLPVESFLEILIKDKLQQPVKLFISYANAAVKFYGIKRIDFSKLYNNKAWNIELTDLYSVDKTFKKGTSSKFKRLNNLYQQCKLLVSSFLNAIKIISAEAEKNLEQTLLPLKEELQKKHPPHLGLLFAFLNIFRYLQNDLNGYTRKHLDFFYKDILQIKSREAVADKAHVIFEIQKQLKNYMVKKGILVKDGKDNNKQEILFLLDDEIVVNKTEVAETRTLFLNNKSALVQNYAEGVYIATDATKADGIDKDFKDDQPKNFPTLGAKLSKYSDPETKIIQPYSNARIGFILGSPVLYLQEGTRTINIKVACQLKDSICEDIGTQIIEASKNCCDDGALGVADPKNEYPNFLSTADIFSQIQTNIQRKYIYLNEGLFKQAIAKGFDKDFIQKIREEFLKAEHAFDPCYCEVNSYKAEISIFWDDWNVFITPLIPDINLRKLLDEIFKPATILNVLFSGEKDWIEPETTTITLGNLFSNTFILTINATLNPEQPAVTYYDKEKLKEDFNTTQPLVKIELNDHLKLEWTILPLLPGKINEPGCCDQDETCCLLKDENKPPQIISFYHFFRNIEVIKKIGIDKTIITDETRINVQVCGLKNFIVQNDESVQDVNGIITPFGNTPKLGSNFYISAKEIFCKNWSEFNLKFNWKDKPAQLENYYHGYEDVLSTPQIQNADFDEDHFLCNFSIIENGVWKPLPVKFKKLFTSELLDFCDSGSENQKYKFIRNDFSLSLYQTPEITCFQKKIFENDTRDGFLKLTLRNDRNLDFQHDRYSFILTRQMMALGKFPDIYVGPVYDGINPGGATTLPVMTFDEMFNSLKRSFELSTNIRDRLDIILPIIAGAHIVNDNTSMLPHSPFYDAAMWNPHLNPQLPFPPNPFPIPEPVPDNAPALNIFSLKDIADYLEDSVLKPIYDKIEGVKQVRVVIPNQPYTPKIQNIILDYKATATLEDINLIHLYPYAGTYKHEEIELQPTLFPTFCNEGTLFLGLKDLIPGNNLNILFQLAEATSDSESQKENVHWHYLDSNVWKPLRKGFKVLDDASENLTTSGIVKFAMPANMTKENTIMPKGLHWIKASIAQNSKAVSETTGIHPQAIRITFTNDAANDKLRLSEPLPGGSLAKLNVADANVKSVQQPYDSFDGRIPEIEQQFYVRVSERLRHKGRAIQKFDYERIALEAFPQLFKAKCINHSFALNAHLYKNDFPYAPGYVILAVIPDLYKLKAGNSFEPKVPVSIIEKIEAYIRKRISVFVRFRAMNPRYEKINFCLQVKLLPGKDENFYQEKLKQDLKELLAPWAVGKYDKLTFGQCIYRSDIIRFLENTDYVDFISDFRMGKETEKPDAAFSKICPDTPRSILIAGDIEVCIDKPDCDDWKKCFEDNNNQIEKDCCDITLIPLANYCIEKNETIG